MRLVEGTALALQIGHRKSIDLDLFGNSLLNEQDLTKCLKPFSDKWIMSKSPSIYAYNINGVKVDFVNYGYEWIEDKIVEGKIRMAGLKDIAAMKINAITG